MGRGLAQGHSLSEAEPGQDPGLLGPSSELCSGPCPGWLAPTEEHASGAQGLGWFGVLPVPSAVCSPSFLGTDLPPALIYPLAPCSCQHEPGPHRGAGGGHVRSGVRPGVCGAGGWCQHGCENPLLGLQGWGWPLLPPPAAPWLCAFALLCLLGPRDVGATGALVSSWSFHCTHQAHRGCVGIGPRARSWRGPGGGGRREEDRACRQDCGGEGSPRGAGRS